MKTEIENGQVPHYSVHLVVSYCHVQPGRVQGVVAWMRQRQARYVGWQMMLTSVAVHILASARQHVGKWEWHRRQSSHRWMAEHESAHDP